LSLAGAAVERVVAPAADELVHAGIAHQAVVAVKARQHVLGQVAGDDVGVAVARAVDRVVAGERQVVDVRAEGVGDRASHEVVALAGLLHDAVAELVDHVHVVARAADHLVGAGAAVERVAAGEADELVAPGAADERAVEAVARDADRVVADEELAAVGEAHAGQRAVCRHVKRVDRREQDDRLAGDLEPGAAAEIREREARRRQHGVVDQELVVRRVEGNARPGYDRAEFLDCQTALPRCFFLSARPP
jgi:hypothetical protein